MVAWRSLTAKSFKRKSTTLPTPFSLSENTMAQPTSFDSVEEVFELTNIVVFVFLPCSPRKPVLTFRQKYQAGFYRLQERIH